MKSPLHLLGIAGSLRTSSHNRALLDTLSRQMPETASLRPYENLAAVPVFNEDDEANGAPGAVGALCEAIRSADGVVFATPEYNQALPGMLKNVLDWVSRDAAGSPLIGKPVAVTGATVGGWGTRIAQQQLRTVLTACGAIVMPNPSIYVARAGEEKVAAESLTAFTNAVVDWVNQIGRS